jgi:hypothetical protein
MWSDSVAEEQSFLDDSQAVAGSLQVLFKLCSQHNETLAWRFPAVGFWGRSFADRCAASRSCGSADRSARRARLFIRDTCAPDLRDCQGTASKSWLGAALRSVLSLGGGEDRVGFLRVEIEQEARTKLVDFSVGARACDAG